MKPAAARLSKNFRLFSYADKKGSYSFQELSDRVAQSLKENDLNQALSHAGRAAAICGAPGLLLHHFTNLKYLAADKAQNGIIQTAGIKALAYLMFCEHLVMTDENEMRRVQQHFPSLVVDKPEFWLSQKNELVIMAEIKGLESEAEENFEVLLALYETPQNVM